MNTEFVFQTNKKQSVKLFVNKNFYGTFEIMDDGYTIINLEIKEYQPNNMLTFFCLENHNSEIILQNVKMHDLDFSELGKKDNRGCALVCGVSTLGGANELLPPVSGNRLTGDYGTINIKYNWPIDIWFFNRLQWIRNKEIIQF